MGTCFLCLEECSNRTGCICNSFLHSDCEEKFYKHWNKKVCPYCKQTYKLRLIIDGEDTPLNVDKNNKTHHKFIRCSNEIDGGCNDSECGFMHFVTKSRKYFWGDWH